MSNANEVSIEAAGTAAAPYDQVFFRTTISAVGTDGPSAKREMQSSSEQVVAYVDSLVKEDRAKNKVALLKLEPNYDRSLQDYRGYKASLEVTFMTERPELAAEIQDKLTTFSQSKVDTLSFGVKDIEGLRETAIEKAWATINRRFQHTATLMEGVSSGWKVSTWDVDYSEHKKLSKLSAPEDDDKGGTATVQVMLTVNFRRED